jgi:peroxiredoxin
VKQLIILLSAMALASACAKEEAKQAPATETPAEPAKPAEPAAAKVEAPAPTTPTTGLGQAPDFTLKDLDGNQVSLSQFKGKIVVLEWFNPGCPFVQYAHDKGPLADMGETKVKEGIVWLAINSGAAGKQGAGADANKKAAGEWNIKYPILLDETGEVGKAYGAKTTPHMYVIDAEGNLVYRGGLDNAPLGEVRGDSHINYVETALAAMAADKPIDTAETQPYGCSVKYAD